MSAPNSDSTELPVQPRTLQALGAVVGYHSLLAFITALVWAIVIAASVYRAEPLEGFPLWFGLAPLTLFLLGLGIRLRFDAVRRLEIVLLPAVGVAATAACLLEFDERGAKPFLVMALYWFKVVYLLKLYRSQEVRTLFALGVRPARAEVLADMALELRGAVGGVLTLVAFGLLVVGFAWARFWFDPTIVDSPWQVLGTLLGAFASAALVFVAGWAAVFRYRARLQSPDRLDPETAARIFALRDQNESLRAICGTLAEEGRLPPGGGKWTPRRVKQVVLTRPILPAQGGTHPT